MAALISIVEVHILFFPAWMLILYGFIGHFGALSDHGERQSVPQRHLAVRIKGGDIYFRDGCPLGALPKPFSNTAPRLYRIQEITRCCLKKGNGFDEV